MSLSCVIIDDEPNAVGLMEMLISQSTDWQIIARCYDGLEALHTLKNKKADLIFLDINMPRLTGMELAPLISPQSRIIFTTAYSEYAAESYEYRALDYLLKPITLKRFLSCVQKVEDHFSGDPANITPENVVQDDHIFIKSGKAYHKLRLSEVLYFEGQREYVNVVTPSGSFLIYRRLKEIEEQLSKPFIRVHQSYIVNLKLLDKVQDNHVHISGKQIPVSDKFREQFLLLLNRNLF